MSARKETRAEGSDVKLGVRVGILVSAPYRPVHSVKMHGILIAPFHGILFSQTKPSMFETVSKI